MSTILITDSLFIGPAEEKLINDAGYDIERLDRPCASEDELVSAIQGKVGYILGGVETVTARVVASTDVLKAIAFTGAGYSEFIPAWAAATKKGIAIAAAAGANAPSVADYALIAGLSLARNLPALTTPEGPSFYTARELDALTLGVVGLGSIGSALAAKALALGLTVLGTPSNHPAPPNVEVTSLEDVIGGSDIVSIHVSKERGTGVLNADHISGIKTGAVVVNAAFEEAIDNNALLARVRSGELRAAVDYPVSNRDGIPAGALLASNAQTAFNTHEANSRISERVTRALLNLLSTGDDPDLVNSDYRDFR